jgi:heme/copper-type cytochrome/quinol oxidase subunit 3
MRSAAAIAILIIWGSSTIYDIASVKYDPPEGLNTIALAAATYLFGSAFIQENLSHNRRDREDDDDES